MIGFNLHYASLVSKILTMKIDELVPLMSNMDQPETFKNDLNIPSNFALILIHAR